MSSSQIHDLVNSLCAQIRSGLSLIQVIACMAYVSFLLFDMWKISLDPVKSLIMTTNPYQIVKLEILSWYWKFLSFSWLAVFLVFLFTI